MDPDTTYDLLVYKQNVPITIELISTKPSGRIHKKKKQNFGVPPDEGTDPGYFFFHLSFLL